MVQVEADIPANLLQISFAGHVEVAETRRSTARVESLLTELQPGFRLLTDLTHLDSMEVACAPQVEHAMDLCNRRGVAIVVRVIPDPHKDIGLNIMSLFHYRGQLRIVTCETLAEARQVLGAAPQK